ncbi:hypothetical protein ACLB2K_070803 [Fragaria x ananassa]
MLGVYAEFLYHICTKRAPKANVCFQIPGAFVRTMLRWEEQLRSEASYGNGQAKYRRGSVVLGEVVIICWPHGEVMRLTTGSTAADAARRVGLDGKLVLVNGQLVLPNTKLTDGDVVEVRA